MPFKKGDENINRKGRKAGTANKTTNELREMVTQVIADNWDVFKTDIKKMDSDRRVLLMDRLLRHVLPAPLHPLDRLTEDEFKELIHDLKNGKYE